MWYLLIQVYSCGTYSYRYVHLVLTYTDMFIFIQDEGIFVVG